MYNFSLFLPMTANKTAFKFTDGRQKKCERSVKLNDILCKGLYACIFHVQPYQLTSAFFTPSTAKIVVRVISQFGLAQNGAESGRANFSVQ